MAVDHPRTPMTMFGAIECVARKQILLSVVSLCLKTDTAGGVAGCRDDIYTCQLLGFVGKPVIGWLHGGSGFILGHVSLTLQQTAAVWSAASALPRLHG